MNKNFEYAQVKSVNRNTGKVTVAMRNGLISTATSMIEDVSFLREGMTVLVGKVNSSYVILNKVAAYPARCGSLTIAQPIITPTVDYYFIHNFETAVDQPDYVWDMEYPDEYNIYYEDTVLDPDAKFGNYACNLNGGQFELYYEPDSTTDEFWPPLTYEFWFKASVIDEYLYGQIWLYGWLGKPEVGLPTQIRFDTWFMVTPYAAYTYMEDRVHDMYFNYISESRYDIPFPLGEYVHYAIVVLPDRIKVFIGGVLFKEYISPMPDGFNVMYTDFYLYNESGAGKILMDAFSIAKGAKYTENFTPPTAPPSR